MKYDDASWHYGGDFPSHLPNKMGSTHISMFLAWACDENLLSDIHEVDNAKEIIALKQHQYNYQDYFEEFCDEKLTNNDFNDTGNGFASIYYGEKYLEDYFSVFGNDGETLYHVEASWENYNRLKPLLDQRFNEWLKNAPAQ